MSEETKALLSPADVALMEELKAGSGEADNSGSFTMIPYITINNKMIEADLNGRKVKVRCEPEFMITEKIGEEYVSSLFAKEFDAIILKFKHRVQRKYKQDQQGNCINKLPFFRSLEFDSFKSDIYIRQNGEFMAPMSYRDVKDMTLNGEENELWGIAYILIEGEDVVRKIEVKGASRGVLFDYMTSPRDYSISSVYTKFSAITMNDAAAPYNKLVLEQSDKKVENLAEIVKKQRELNAMLLSSAVPGKTAHIAEYVESQDIPATVEQIEACAQGETLAGDPGSHFE